MLRPKMDPEALQAAAELCRLVDAPDLLAWLDLPRDASNAEARSALDRRRKRLQSMQGNPKYRDSARFLIKNFRRIEVLFEDVAGYLEATAAAAAESQLPLLELVIDGVLADGVVTPNEVAFVREQAARLGIASELFERMLRERCEARGIPLPDPPPVPVPAKATVGPTTGNFRLPMRTLQVAHRAAGTGWWDDDFTAALLRVVPEDTERLVDLSCGLAWSALALLPARPQLEYLGIDPDEMHVKVARRNLGQAELSSRARIHCADPTRLPLPDDAVDAVICIMSLQAVPDTRPLFQQAARILRPGGRFVTVEPDCMGQQFWFDGNLPTFDDAFRNLCARVDAILRDGSPADDPLGRNGLSIGPTLAARMRAVSLATENARIHPIQVSQASTAAAFGRRLRRRVDAMQNAGALPDDDPSVVGARDAIAAFERVHPRQAVGMGVHLLPLFVVVGFAS